MPAVQWKKLGAEEESRLNDRAAERAIRQSYVEPFKLKIVMSSLPFLTDSQTIKHALEQCKGNINNAVSMLIEADEAGSISSTQESSSVERDQDSDDEAIYGPNKRANRSRIHRASRNLMKDSQQRRAEMVARMANNDGSQESVSHAIGDLEIPDSKDNSPAPGETEDEWVPERSGSEMTPDPSVSRGPTRLKINVSKLGSGSGVGKTHARQQGPHGLPAREQKAAKKREQKDARKRRAQQEAKGGDTTANALPIHTRPHASSPAPGHVESHLKTLYI